MEHFFRFCLLVPRPNCPKKSSFFTRKTYGRTRNVRETAIHITTAQPNNCLHGAPRADKRKWMEMTNFIGERNHKRIFLLFCARPESLILFSCSLALVRDSNKSASLKSFSFRGAHFTLPFVGSWHGNRAKRVQFEMVPVPVIKRLLINCFTYS